MWHVQQEIQAENRMQLKNTNQGKKKRKELILFLFVVYEMKGEEINSSINKSKNDRGYIIGNCSIKKEIQAKSISIFVSILSSGSKAIYFINN